MCQIRWQEPGGGEVFVGLGGRFHLTRVGDVRAHLWRMMRMRLVVMWKKQFQSFERAILPVFSSDTSLCLHLNLDSPFPPGLPTAAGLGPHAAPQPLQACGIQRAKKQAGGHHLLPRGPGGQGLCGEGRLLQEAARSHPLRAPPGGAAEAAAHAGRWVSVDPELGR
jgi:hypothetical protein